MTLPPASAILKGVNHPSFLALLHPALRQTRCTVPLTPHLLCSLQNPPPPTRGVKPVAVRAPD